MPRRESTLDRSLGAAPTGDGAVAFRVWAPNASGVAVRSGGRDQPLDRADACFWESELELPAGIDYLYVLDGERAWPDPCSRFQPEGVRGPSRVVDPVAFEWNDGAWAGVALEELVLYELHVGTFSEEGTFDGAIQYLDELRDLGVTAIELMPVATFPGNRGWGYDGLYTYAPHPAYGGPDGLARLVDAAHAAGLGVLLDVVYNHVGPGSEALAAFGPYFTDRHETFWGEAIDYSRPAVREWAIQNACLWARDYHVDGFRLDAVQAIFDDDSTTHVLAELADRVREQNPRALVISETEVDDYRPVEDWGHDAQWVDRFHHELHVLLTGERDGYYERFGSLPGLARELERQPAERLVVYAQNHDQVGNRAQGDRLPPELLRVAAAVTLFSTHTPLLFMGEEYGEERPFQFFSDHIDPAIAEATRAGRKREFERFAAFGSEVPDPQARDTFERSKLDRSRADDGLLALHRELLSLRRELPPELEVEFDEQVRTLRARRGGVELVADFTNATVELHR